MSLCCCIPKKKTVQGNEVKQERAPDLLPIRSNLKQRRSNHYGQLYHQGTFMQKEDLLLSVNTEKQPGTQPSESAVQFYKPLVNGHAQQINFTDDYPEDASEYLLRRYQLLAEGINRACSTDLPLFYPVPDPESLPPGKTKYKPLSPDVPGRTLAAGNLPDLLEQAYGGLLQFEALDEFPVVTADLQPIVEEGEEEHDDDEEEVEMKSYNQQPTSVRHDSHGHVELKRSAPSSGGADDIADIGADIEECAEWMTIQEFQHIY